MKRSLSGDLANLAPPTVIRLLSASSPCGVLEFTTAAGALRLEIVGGEVLELSEEKRSQAQRVLASGQGSFRFDPGEVAPLTGPTVLLATLAEPCWRGSDLADKVFASDLDVDQLIARDRTGGSSQGAANIHVLPAAALENPLDGLLSELENAAPDELLFAQVGVVASEPRLWRGSLETNWRRRGWQMHLYGVPTDPPLGDLDALIVHHQLSISRVGSEADWIELITQAQQAAVPVVWIGPLGDSFWVSRLIAAGVAFLMPKPQGTSGEIWHRLQDSLTLVIARHLGRRQRRESELPGALSDLVDALIYDADPEEAIGCLLQVAAGQLLRGAILGLEDTAFRCRAGFGYPLNRGCTGLPRGVGLLERVVRSAQALTAIDPEGAGALHLARVLGVAQLAPATAVIPLGRGTAISGVLIADREGRPLPDLGELVLLACRLGGGVVQ